MAEANFQIVLKKFPKGQQKALMVTIGAIEELFPAATRAIAWGMPTLKVGADNLCHVMGFKDHNSLFPASGAIAASMSKELAKYVVSKGTIHFELEKPFPKPLLKKILLARLRQINDSYPKKNGEYVQYFGNGQMRISGKYVGEIESGKWTWYYSDGNIKKEGSFRKGLQSGLWRTYCPVTGEIKTEKTY